jgi:hypothetical protein
MPIHDEFEMTSFTREWQLLFPSTTSIAFSDSNANRSKFLSFLADPQDSLFLDTCFVVQKVSWSYSRYDNQAQLLAPP